MKKQILVPSILALFVASAAHAGATFDTEAGSLYLGGDVEFDFTSETSTNAKAAGRLLIDIHGEHALENGAFAAFQVAPTFDQAGANGDADDADNIYFQFGMKDDWNIKTGSFEATNLSTAGQDTYIAEVGSANGGATVYRADKARGRTSASGDIQVTATKSMGDSAFEVTVKSTSSGELVIARPVLTYSADMVSFAAGLEVPVNDSTESYEWVGAGATATFTLSDELAVTLRAAYITGDDALGTANNTSDEGSAMTAGVGAQYNNFYAAVLYATDDAEDNAYDVDETRLYASYKIPAIMDIDNFDIYLGAGYAFAEDSDNDKVGGKVRLKYNF